MKAHAGPPQVGAVNGMERAQPANAHHPLPLKGGRGDGRHWLDEPKNVKLLWRLFLIVLAITVLAEPFAALRPHFEVEALFGFHAWYGFAACAAMILVAKGLGLLLKRPDDYYGSDGDE
ncbi:hypothetical protein BURK2_04558 [Burkholderiales bacterium]|nr:hypothetical protein BURK2_04558 [Burkholderiales bacterium]